MLIVASSLLGLASISFGQDYFPIGYNWGFQNSSCLNFSQSVNFVNSPHQGVPNDSSLIGYWNMDEGLGTIAYDSSGNGNNGNINDATWTTGKFYNALSFNGTGHEVIIHDSPVLHLTNAITISAWINPSSLSNVWNFVLSKQNAYELACYDGHIAIRLNLGTYGDKYIRYIGPSLTLNEWHSLVMTYDGTNFNAYVDGKLVSNTVIVDTINSNANDLHIGSENGAANFVGSIDDVRIHNRALSTNEVAALYDQSDPVSFANYYYFADSITNNTLIVHIDNLDAESKNVAAVTCSSFFTDDKLVFQANSSVTVNVWTNLGEPLFTTGIWNSQNYTTSLTLNASSTAELNWNTFNITTYTDYHSSISPSNMTVSYGGSQQFNMTADSGYFINHVYIDGTDQGNLTTHIFSNITDNHLIEVTSAQIVPAKPITTTPSPTETPSIPLSTTTSSPIPSQTASPDASQTPQPTTPQPTITVSQPVSGSQFTIVNALIVAVAIEMIIAGFVIAFKKRYITIAVVEEENLQESVEDYAI